MVFNAENAGINSTYYPYHLELHQVHVKIRQLSTINLRRFTQNETKKGSKMDGSGRLEKQRIYASVCINRLVIRPC